MLNLLIDVLACWRLVSLLMEEAGPGDVLVKMRRLTGIEHDADGIPVSFPNWNPLKCFYCTSMWVALVMGWMPLLCKRILAISGAAILVDKVVYSGKS